MNMLNRIMRAPKGRTVECHGCGRRVGVLKDGRLSQHHYTVVNQSRTTWCAKSLAKAGG